MGANLSLNTNYEIEIKPDVWVSSEKKKTKKNNNGTFSEELKQKYIQKYISSSKFKKNIKNATHITNLSDYVKDKLKFIVKNIKYDKKNNLIYIQGIWIVDRTVKVPMELHDVKESDVADHVKDGLHKEGYSGEIMIGKIPQGKIYLGFPSNNIKMNKL